MAIFNDFKCPWCGVYFNINHKNSEHQVNDHFDLTFCSYDCSKQFTNANKELLTHLTDDEIEEGL